MPSAPSKLRVSIWEWSLTILLSANLAWTTLCLGGFLPATVVVTSLLTAALLIVYAVGASRGFGGVHPAALWFVPFLVYAAANVVWVTPVRWLGLIDMFNWAQMIAVFWVVLNGIRTQRARAVLFGTLLTLGAAAVWFAGYQHFVQPTWLMLGRTQAEQYVGRSSGPFGIPNSLAAFLLLLVPAVGALALRRQATLAGRIFFGWLLIVFVVGLGLSVSRGAWLALGISLTLWPMFAARVQWRKRIAIAAAVAASLVVAGVLAFSTSSLVHERFTEFARDAGERSRPILWRAAWQMFREQPVFGVGAGSFNVRFEKYRPGNFSLQPVWAHNDYLNTLSDYGAVGFALFFGTAVIVALIVWRRGGIGVPSGGRSSLPRQNWLDDPIVRQGLGIGILAFVLQLAVDFHFKIPALAMSFASIAGLLVSRSWPHAAAPGGFGYRPILAVIALAVAAGVGFEITPLYRGEALRFAARESIDRMAQDQPADPIVRSRLIDILQKLDRAVKIAPDDGQAWADHSYALAQWSRFHPADVRSLGRQAENDADRAIALSPVVPEFWIRRGVALDMQNRWDEAGPEFAKATVLSPNGVLPWFHYAYHMSLRPTGLDMAQAALEFCLDLDPTNPEVQRLRQHLATSRSGL